MYGSSNMIDRLFGVVMAWDILVIIPKSVQACVPYVDPTYCDSSPRVLARTKSLIVPACFVKRDELRPLVSPRTRGTIINIQTSCNLLRYSSTDADGKYQHLRGTKCQKLIDRATQHGIHNTQRVTTHNATRGSIDA